MREHRDYKRDFDMIQTAENNLFSMINARRLDSRAKPSTNMPKEFTIEADSLDLFCYEITYFLSIPFSQSELCNNSSCFHRARLYKYRQKL